MSTNSSMSGWVIGIVSISAPLRPCCPISPVVIENKSIKETAPLVVFAALLTEAPRGASLPRSVPQPPP